MARADGVEGRFVLSRLPEAKLAPPRRALEQFQTRVKYRVGVLVVAQRGLRRRTARVDAVKRVARSDFGVGKAFRALKTQPD